MQGGIEIAGLPPIVIPVFVSNMGCPHRCVFCDQRQNAYPMPPSKVEAHVEEFISRCRHPQNRQRVVAFFGGSFTGIDDGLLSDYLDVTRSLIHDGRVHAAKASTRPDMVSEEKLQMLYDAGFRDLEIGIQSMDDEVLKASSRGHTKDDAIRACASIKSAGMNLGIQLMPGLPGENIESFKKTIEAVLGIRPENARIYPTIVLEGTPLEDMYLKGEYRPLTLDEAVNRTLFASIKLEDEGCTILRMGVPSSPGLKITAGPYHDSFGFLVRARGYGIMAQSLVGLLGRGCKLSVNSKAVPELVGYKRSSLKELDFSFSFDDTIPRGYIRAGDPRESACI